MIEEIKENAINNKVPIIKDGGLQFILDYIKNNNVKSILELGTAVGYSSICMAKLNNDIHIDTIEKNSDMYHQAISNIKNEGLENQINVIFSDIDNVNLDKKYDLIFVDAAKAQYRKYLEHFLSNLKDDGIMIFDNMVFHNLIYNIDSIQSRNLRSLVRKIVAFRETIKDDKRFEVSFYDDIGDGILTLKRKEMSEKDEILKGLIKEALIYLKNKNIDINDVDTDFSDVLESLKNGDEDLSELSKEYFADIEKSKQESKEIKNDDVDEEFIDDNDDFLKTIKSAVDVNNDKIKEIEIPTPENLDSTIDEINQNDTGYLDDLLDELKEDAKENKYEDNAYQELKSYYHNLTNTFIKTLYDNKKIINQKYKFYKDIIVLHRIKFTNISDLQSFVDFLSGLDYNFNVDENKLIVDVLMEIENSDGKISYLIFDMADKAVGRKGEYLGYSVLDAKTQSVIND